MTESLNINQEPLNPDEIKKRKMESRRSFLKRALGGVGGAAVILGGGVVVLKNSIDTQTPKQKAKKAERQQEEKDNEELPPLEIIEDAREYKSGDHIRTPAGAIEIDGWKVAMGDMAVSGMSYFALSGEKNYTLRFKSPEDGKSWAVYTSGERKEVDFPVYNTLDVRGRHENQKMFYLLPNLRSPVMVLEVFEFPGDKASLEQEIFTKEEDLKKIRRAHKRQASKMHRYHIRLSGSASSLKNSEKVPRVFAEGKIPQSGLDKVADVHRLAGAFHPVAPVYVYGEGDNDPYWKVAAPNQHFDPGYNRVALSHREFTHPDVPGQAEQVACHEICHSIMYGSKFEGTQNEAYKKVREGFFNISKQADPGREKSWNDPAFIIFREFSYYKVKPDAKKVLPAGHPWDNPDELFASAVTVFRYYSKDFVGQLEKLNPKTKTVVKEAAQNIFGLLRSMNPDPVVLKRFIPNIEAIEKAVGKTGQLE
jgi:hypothetical protein